MANRKKNRVVEPLEIKLTEHPIAFPIVGVGASAGGFEAFSELLAALPAETGMAFVLIQHLDPTHESMLAPLLARRSKLPVSQVGGKTAIERNHVYVIPPNSRMTIEGGFLKLTGRSMAGDKHMPVDHFLQSLAMYRKDAAVGVILSGTASDGTVGLEAIKAAGGLCFAQEEASAKYPGMPASAIAAGVVDFVLSPPEIAAELLRLAHPNTLASSPAATPATGGDDALGELLLLIRKETGVDFTHYKASTVHRRIARRMLLKKLPDVRAYFECAQNDAAELDALYHDILIPVTSFFREPESFRTLESHIVPKLLEGKGKDDPLRIWVPGCSTGEEAYSIAIVLSECLGKRRASVPVRIFATDISEHSILRARAGVYAVSKMAPVSPVRRERVFVKSNDSFQVAEPIRDMCTFARHDLTRDPPFSRIDLISCRNVLIYLEPILQKRIFAVFHFALKSDGVLLLGKSESVNAFPRPFGLIEKKAKFYRRKEASDSRLGLASALFDGSGLPQRALPPAIARTDLQREADEIVWSRYGHAGVVVDEDLHILHFRGDTSRYLAPASGEASLNLLGMVRRELAIALSTAFQEAKKTATHSRREFIPVTSPGRAGKISLDVIPMASADTAKHHFLVLFDSALRAPVKEPGAPEPIVIPAASVQRELLASRANLQAVLEEQTANNEELRALNEEFLSNNEELQSASEELESAREELQSANEELVTLTEQEASRNAELAGINDDLRNVLDGVQIPILILDNQHRIRRFTPSVARIFNLLPADVGRAIHDFRPNLNFAGLPQLISHTIETLTPQEREVTDLQGRYYSMSLRPYRRYDGEVDGVLMVLFDIDAMKRSMVETRRARDYARAIVETVREPLVVLDSRLRVATANQSFFAAFRLSPKEVGNQSLFELAGGAWGDPDLRRLLEQVLLENAQFADFKLNPVFPTIGLRRLVLNARRLQWESEAQEMILLAIEDRTESELAAEALQHRERLRDLIAGLISPQEEERRRIARELHDDLNQRLAMLVVELETLERNPPRSAELIGRRLAILRSRIESISDDIRQTAHQLHPSTVEHLGLAAAMRSLCADVAKRENIQVHCRERHVNRFVPPDISLCIYRVAQGAIHNVLKHSGARRVTISLLIANSRILLWVRDAGSGFNPEVPKINKGLGIVNMEERARLVGGKLSIRSRPGAGTRVVLEIPLPEPLS
jgi:two-component system CheB/CheR fusion protein